MLITQPHFPSLTNDVTAPPNPTGPNRASRRLGDYGWADHVITTSADSVFSVFAIDIDGDGDTDVLSASANDDTVAWYENLDGSGGICA